MSSRIKRSFSLIELIFTIVILGIIGTLSSDIIVSMYKSYVMRRDMLELESKVASALESIEKRLEDSIEDSIVDENFALIINRSEGNTTVIQWIGKDIESLQGIWNDDNRSNYPCYSGLVDIVSSSEKNIATLGNDLSCIDDIEGNITDMALKNGVDYRSVLYFTYANKNGTPKSRFWENPTSLFKIESFDEQNITLVDKPNEIGERYFLSYSAYAIELNIAEERLYFYDNFRPWNDQDYDVGRKNILIDGVDVFQMWSESGGGIYRIYLCARKKIGGMDEYASFCKEGIITL